MFSINLNDLNGSNGLRLNGIDANDSAGISVSDAGDINGDGIADVIIGASRADIFFSSVGESYIVFGSTGGFSASLDLSALDGSNGFRLDGIDGADISGYSVSAAGDVNGDGIDDVIIGAPFADGATGDEGESYIVFGSTAGFTAVLDLDTLNGTNGFRIDGIDDGDTAGRTVSNAGDVNGDGIDDILIGARDADPGSDREGEIYVVFGSTGGFSASFDLSGLDGSNGFRLDGIDIRDYAGISLSNAGDLNGDGIDDIVVGATNADITGLSDGESYVVFGSTAGFASSLDLSALDGSNGFRLDGEDNLGQSGSSVSAAGDLNGDGIDDLIIGARGARPDGIATGGAYVVFGSTGGFASSLDLSTLDGNTGFRLDGVELNDNMGVSVSHAGDVNGDGIDDVIIGSEHANANGDSSGDAYVLFGSTAGFSASLDLSTLNGSQGFRIEGAEAGDRTGFSVSGAGDVNGDGFDDLIVGGPDAGTHNDYAGSAYIVFGFSTSPTAGNDVIVSNGGADTIDGLGGKDFIGGETGNDSLVGSGGNDTLEGGNGSDTLVGGNGKDLLEGGAGADSLVGNNGIDTASYASSGSGITVDLRPGTGTGGHAQGDTLTQIENLIGSGASDSLVGDGGPNRFEGGGGNDTLEGGDGNDTLLGQDGGDELIGGDGNDTLLGGSGNDSLDGNGGADSLNGGDGADTLDGGNASDTLVGNKGNDSLVGGNAGDLLRGGANRDTLEGDGGDDTLEGGNANDSLLGGANEDSLDGGGGVDTLLGGGGDDTLDGGAGDDSLNGEGGLDTYIFFDGDGADTLDGFEDGLDILDVSQHASITDFGDITETQQGADLLITFDADDSVLLLNTQEADIDGSDFFFGA